MGLFGPRQIACCPRDGAPLISTMAFRKAEFYCLDCGGRIGFMSPRGKDETEENLAVMNAYQKEWDDNVDGKLIIEGRSGTDEEQAAHDRAMAWLEQRKLRVPA